MISNHLSSRRGSSCRKSFSRQFAARYAATALAIAAVSFVSPLCPKPASAQTSGGVTAQLSFLQSLDNPIYLNINLLGQQLTNYGLTLGPNGNLFGTTATGGLLNQGSVYEVSPSGQIQLLHSFANSLTDGGTPSGSLTLGPDGNLYGVTKSGGAGGDGTVYQVTPSGVVTTLYSFSGGATGALPTGTLSIGSDGTITGTTTAGGTSNLGTVYQLANPTTSPALTILHSFTGGTTDGSDPVSGVIQAANGDLYGTTTGGGAAADGTVFQIADNAGNAVESLVHSFAGGTGDGSDPVGGLIQTASGALAGTTAAGGANNLGTVYQVADAATQPVETVLQSFNGTNGGDPVSSLIQTANGTLLGTTMLGGANNQGTVFAALQSGTISTLESFTGNNSVVGSVLDETGDTPASPLVQGASDTIYGTTDSAGLHNTGAMYKLILPSAVTGITPTRFDINADGYADILFYNSINGELSYWTMDDETVENYGAAFAQIAPSSGWIPVGEPDTNGDGQPDILFWNQNTGAMSVWNLKTDSTSVSQYGPTFATVPDTTWMPSAIANDQGNGQYEIVFQNTVTGNISAWHMNGTTVTNYGGTISSAGANSGWHLVGAPDLSGDGKSDYLFWNSATGDVSYWTMDDDSVAQYNVSFATVNNTDWHLVGAPDLNDDGEADLVWENMATGDVARWQMNGASVTNYGDTIANVGAGSGWSVQGER